MIRVTEGAQSFNELDSSMFGAFFMSLLDEWRSDTQRRSRIVLQKTLDFFPGWRNRAVATVSTCMKTATVMMRMRSVLVRKST